MTESYDELSRHLFEVEEHIWQHQRTGKFYFEDETSDITNGPYDTREAAKIALWQYIDKFISLTQEVSS